jgi:hypothetical protein
MRVLDLFAGKLGWAKAFLSRGHEVVAIDLVDPGEVPAGCTFIQADIRSLQFINGQFIVRGLGMGLLIYLGVFDWICCSSPCEQFSLWGQRHFFPNPPHPAMGIELFNHSRHVLEESGVPYVMENVRAAQQFIGWAAHHAGSFYLWGPGTPPLMPQGIKKGLKQYINPVTRKRDSTELGRRSWSKSDSRLVDKAIAAIIPPELANCVADYAERVLVAKNVA